ncbi:MAG: hypothetical protein JKY42_01170 [Flavobacteriales bacterium]|nr:hypothetical protein [Flavobacteriales bacterium]
MDNLAEIIQTLSTENHKEFRIFINRNKSKKKRKDFELYQILKANTILKPQEIIQTLYPDSKNTVAYHALRKRLLTHLTDFLVFKRLEEDTTAASVIMGLHSLASYLFDHQNSRLAWKHLKRAEELAIANEQFELLNSLYNLMIEKANTDFAEELHSILEKRKINKTKVEEEERVNIAYSLIRKKLNEHKAGKKNLNFDTIIREILQSFSLETIINQRPKILYKIMTITRSAIIATKDFYSFEPYIIAQFKQVEKLQGFSKSNHYYKVNLLYMIAHVLYRNRKFEASLQYLELLLSDLMKYDALYFKGLFHKYTLLNASCLAFLGKNKVAIEITEDFIENHSNDIPEEARLNALINLMIYNFQVEDYKKSIKWVLQIQHTDQWCEKKMGKEWVLKKNLMEMILQYEMGNIDIVLNRIRSFERSNERILKRPLYHSVNNFLQLIKEIVNNPLIADSPEFQERVRSTLVVKPHEQEDLQGMGFYAWLKSKIVKQPYYEVLVELVNRR